MYSTLMRGGLGVFAIAFLLTACNVDQSPSSNSPVNNAPIHRNGDVIPGQYIVVFHENAVAQKGENLQSLSVPARVELVKQAAKRAAINIGMNQTEFGLVFGTAVQGAVMKLTEREADQLRADNSVRFVEQDRWITLPPLKINSKPGDDEEDPEVVGRKPKGSSDGGSSTQTTPWGVTVVGGAKTPLSSTTAWIVDTGIDLDHPDLNVVTSRCKNYVTSGTNTTSAEDGHGHGSHVAGTIGAKDNTIGVIGIAPGVKLVAMRVLDETGSGQWSWSIAAFDHIAANGASGDVVNYSVGAGSRFSSSTLDAAVRNVADKGIKVCIAAGNQADDASYYSPAKVDYTNVYSIAAMTSYYIFASWSNYGTPVDWIEPGSNIPSTYKNGGYATMSGTSMATPHATGMLAVGSIVSGGSVSSVPASTVSTWGKRQ